MLKVCSPSPPVPHVSMYAGDRGRTGVARSRIARANPTISSMLSPFMRIAVTSERDLRVGGLAVHDRAHDLGASSSESEVARRDARDRLRWPPRHGPGRPRRRCGRGLPRQLPRQFGSHR
jgi:hypothetical protein